MMDRRLVLATGLALASVTSTLPDAARAQDNGAVVADVRRIIADNYVVREKRAPLDAALAAAQAAGRYDGIDAATLSERVTADLAAVANDGHLGLRFAPTEAAGMTAPQADDDESDPFMDEQARRTNHGITDLRVLDANIRYINYRGFMWSGRNGRDSAAVVDRAAAFLRDGDAIIIDLRDNGGGDPRAVRHLASYFVPPKTRLITFHLRSAPPEVVHSAAKVAGGRIQGKPVYVLTSRRSFSAAEEFASHARYFGFATLVGGTTGGGAYRNALYPVARQYILSVSIGRPELSDGSNWEGKGVEPKIAVSPDLALDAALADALGRIAQASSGGDRAVASRLAIYHQSLVRTVDPVRSVDAYVGTYGQRVVRKDITGLTIQRGNGPVSRLIPIGPDRFALSGDPTTQAVFTGTDRITGLDIERADGRREAIKRDS